MLRVFKFLIPTSCLAVVLAENETDARSRLMLYAAENGFDYRWLEVAQLTEIQIAPKTVLAYVMI